MLIGNKELDFEENYMKAIQPHVEVLSEAKDRFLHFFVVRT